MTCAQGLLRLLWGGPEVGVLRHCKATFYKQNLHSLAILFFLTKITKLAILFYLQKLPGLETNFKLRDRNHKGSRPRPVRNTRDHKKSVSRLFINRNFWYECIEKKKRF